MVLQTLLSALFLNAGMVLASSEPTIQRLAAESIPSTDRPIARFSSWVLFSGGRVVQGAPFLAYGHLSEISEIPQLKFSLKDESSAVLTFIIEGKTIDMRRGEDALLIESEGTLRVFFDSKAKRNFADPRSFRTGKEVATYTLQRQVLFKPDDGWLFDRSFAQLTTSQNFTIDKTEFNLLRLWGTRLTLRSQARAGDGLPSPVPEFSGAIPYLGQIFIDAERTERQYPTPTTVTYQDSFVHGQNWD
jgi:hypothetical protein